MGSGGVVLLDSFTRVRDTLHRTLGDLTPEELHCEPHPSIGWLAWRLTRVTDSNISARSNRGQMWIADGWAERFGMKPEPADFGRGVTHTREQVRIFQATVDLLLGYHDAIFARTSAYLEAVTDEELARVLDEPQYTPRPTVSVRLVSVLDNAMSNAGMISYLKGYHRQGGWFPAEAADRPLR